jgi:hypothetical protein
MTAMENGLYKIRFWISQHGGDNVGTGIVLLQDGLMRGGDSITAHSGTYALNGSEFCATVRVCRHSEGRAIAHGLDHAVWTLQGHYEGGTARLQGTTADWPNQVMMFTLDRFDV